MKNKRNYYRISKEADYTRKAGVWPSNMLSLEDGENIRYTLQTAYNAYKENNKRIYSETIKQGPLWDFLTPGSGMAVSERLKNFLLENTNDDIDFFPIHLTNSKGNELNVIYYGLIITNIVMALDDDDQLITDEVEKNGNNFILARNPKEIPKYGIAYLCDRPLIKSDLAKKLIDNNFTGLGFSTPESFTSKPIKRPKSWKYIEETDLEEFQKNDPLHIIKEIITSENNLLDDYMLLREKFSKLNKKVLIDIDSGDITSDIEKCNQWITNTYTEHTPPKSIQAFMYGIYDNAECLEPTLSVCGSTDYVDDSMYDFDWACNPKWHPDTSYISTVLTKIINSFKEEENLEFLDVFNYFFVLGYYSLLVKHSFQNMKEISTFDLGKRAKTIAVGFDDGDAVIIGKYKQDNLELLN